MSLSIFSWKGVCLLISKEQVKHIADLARLTLTQEEVGQYQAELNEILQAAEKLRNIDTEGVLPATPGVALRDLGRGDIVKPGLDQRTALGNGPQVVAGHFRVPKILGEE